jgi:hypothetical protein
MGEENRVNEEKPGPVGTIVFVNFVGNHGWERFLQILFPGIKEIQFKKKYWGPKRDFLRVIGWYLWRWGVFE